jgi:hypothetical protein
MPGARLFDVVSLEQQEALPTADAVLDLAQVHRQEVGTAIHTMPIEVHHMVRCAARFGITQRLAQRGEGRRAQHVELEYLARLGAQALDQTAGDRAERHVVAPAGAADHQQNADDVLLFQR